MDHEPRKWRISGRLCGDWMSDEQKRGDTTDESPVEVNAQNTAANSTSANENESLQALLKQARCLFSGSYTHGIDAKGRMIVPANFRQSLGDKFVVAPTPDFQAIALYPLLEWVREQEKLEELADIDARAQRLILQFNKYSYTDSETDAQGRLLLPQKMRSKYLGDARDVEISGAKTYIRVVDSAVGDKEDEDFLKDIPDPLAFIAQLQREKNNK